MRAANVSFSGTASALSNVQVKFSVVSAPLSTELSFVATQPSVDLARPDTAPVKVAATCQGGIHQRYKRACNAAPGPAYTSAVGEQVVIIAVSDPACFTILLDTTFISIYSR